MSRDREVTGAFGSSYLVGVGIPARRLNRICDLLGFPKPGRGRARRFGKDEAIILFLANMLFEVKGAKLFEMGAVVRMISMMREEMKCRGLTFAAVDTLCWGSTGEKHDFKINAATDEVFNSVVYLRNCLPKELLPDEFESTPQEGTGQEAPELADQEILGRKPLAPPPRHA